MLESFGDVAAFVLVVAVVTGVAAEVLLRVVMAMVRGKSWWPRAAPLQKALMVNFGYPESSCHDEALIDTYAYVIVLCGHHILCGSLMLPVVVNGWEAAGPMGQACMLIGALMDVSIDLYDWIKMFFRTFLFETTKSVWPVPCPKDFFVVLGVLHHPLAMLMVIPVVLCYPDLRAFHLIACALLFAAGICFTLGSYKFTLDVSTQSGFYQYKAIVLAQLLTILYSRGYVWFVQLSAAILTFYADGRTGFVVGACAGGATMSLFNVIMVADAVQAAVKWLPKSLPKGKEAQEELDMDMVKSVSASPGKGVLSSGRSITQTLGLTSAGKVRSAVKVAVAAARFKKGLKEPLLNKSS